jgi:ADP-heptose:LPS heptosyltransferase
MNGTMRILTCHPDTMGDVVLRQPLLSSLREAGHELAMTLRPAVAPIARFVASDARVIVTEADLYQPSLTPDDPSLASIVESARGFDPEILLVTPFQWTALEERLHAELPRARLVAMKGHPFVDPEWPPAYVSKIAASATIDAEEREAETAKNQRLASAILGRAITLPRPTITADAASRELARAELADRGLKPGGYCVACLGHTASTAVRNWPMDRWAELLCDWSVKHGRAFLLVGHEAEADSCRPVVEAIESAGGSVAGWFGSSAASIETLIGLISLSSGYVGRDTGPMHLAAALEKRVLAVFGQGTWPRFLPAAKASISIAMNVPCAGCDWRCHLQRSHCIQDVPMLAVREAAEALESGQIDGPVVRALEPPATLLASIVRESAAAARRVSPGNLMNQFALLERAVKAETSLTHTQQDVSRVHQDLLQARGELERARQELAALQMRMQHAEAERTQDQQQLVRVQAEARDDAERQRGVTAHLRQELEAMLGALAESERRRSAAEDELHSIKAGGVADAESASGLRLALERTHAEKAKAVSELHDARLTVAKLREDVMVATRHGRQHEQDLALVRQRLHELMASRWRKVGQRLGVAMVMPWEREGTGSPSTNGQAKH